MLSLASRPFRAALLVSFAALPLAAQTTPAPDNSRISQLEKRLDELTRQVGEIRTELDRLKSGAPAATTPPTPAQPAVAADLTKIDVAPPTAVPATAATSA